MPKFLPSTLTAKEAFKEALQRIRRYQNEGARSLQLDLSGLGLTELPLKVIQLTTLKSLRLDQNQFTTLPPEIGQLTSLTVLRLDHNPLITLPPEIGQLAALTELTLHSNSLVRLPAEIGLLSRLIKLDLSYNNLTTLPPEICRLSKLSMLRLSGNQLTSLPHEIGKIPSLTEVYLHSNPNLRLPAEVLGPKWVEASAKNPPAKPEAIFNYYFAHRQAMEDEGTEPLMEAKVLVLGEASVGKSCLIAALTKGLRRAEVPDTGTRGIVRQMWEVPVKDGEWSEAATGRRVETLRLNCWDFGGQEIYHSAHTLFLTTRAVYLIVLSKRDNERQNNVDYWLRMAASFGGPDAVIYVVVNKYDEPVGHPPDMAALRLRHPRLRGFLETSCENLTGIHAARKVIVREALRLEGVRQPVARTWLTVKKKLEKMSEHTLSMEEWANLCGQKVATPEGRRELLHLCDRLGTVRYFPTTKEQMADACEAAILNPEWVTLGIYALLDDEQLKMCGGMIDRPRMTAILKGRGYPIEHVRIIEEVMRRFDLLYDSADHDEKHRMLIPLMMPTLMPVFPWPVESTLEFRFQYQVMPAGLLPAFIARMHLHLSKTVPSWRNGCVLEHKLCQARVIADTEQKRVLISVYGSEILRREVLDEVRFTFSALHNAIEQLPVEELIPVPGRPEAPMLKYSYIRSLHWKSIAKIEAEGTVPGEIITVNVRDALDGVRGQAQRERDDVERTRSEERSGGDVHYHQHEHKTDITMHTDSHNITIHGNVADAQVGQTLSHCTNMIQLQTSSEVKTLLTKLEREVQMLIPQLPADKQTEVTKDWEMMVKESTSATPSRKWYSVSSEGLLEASQFVKELSGAITDSVKDLTRLLWPS